MEDSDGERSDEVSVTQGESDYGNIPTRKRHFHLEGTKEKEEREKRTADQRVQDRKPLRLSGFNHQVTENFAEDSVGCHLIRQQSYWTE